MPRFCGVCHSVYIPAREPRGVHRRLDHPPEEEDKKNCDCPPLHNRCYEQVCHAAGGAFGRALIRVVRDE